MSFSAQAFIRENTVITTAHLVPEVSLHLATEITPLWQVTEERLRQGNLPPPYWAFAWPGGQGMARYLLNDPSVVRGKRVLDFAAGSGIAAIAAKMAGAECVLASDIDPLALAAIHMNASRNNVTLKTLGEIDLGKAYANVDIIMAGDVCYQQAMSASMLRWLMRCREQNIRVFLADPGRAYVPHEGLVERAQYQVKTSRDLEDSEIRTVTVWEMLDPGEITLS